MGGHHKAEGWATDWVGGCIAGSANLISGYPFDTVKVRLQASTRGTYQGTWHCLSSILRYEGVAGLYRGMSSPLIGAMLETGLNYTVYESMLRAQRVDMDHLTLFPVVVAASAAGGVLSLVLSPFELIKDADRAVGRHKAFKSTAECVAYTIKHEGLRGLTRGVGATIAREVPGNAVFFSIYEGARQLFPAPPPSGDPAQDGVLQVVAQASSAILCGGLAGCAMWASVLPLDVAKTRIQTASPGSPTDVGILGNLRLIYSQGGVRGLYAGLTPTLVRAFPANACQWLAWELFMREVRRRQDQA